MDVGFWGSTRERQRPVTVWWRDREDGSLQSLTYGTIQTPASVAAHQRLSMLFHQLTDLILLHRPDSCAVEKLFFQSNVKTAIAVGQGACGVTGH